MSTASTHRPADEPDLIDLIGQAGAAGRRLELRGGGTKASIGASVPAEVVDMRAFSTVVDYDPAELVISLGAGATLADAQALVDRHGQMLAFDPFDHGPIFGRPAGAATIGGVIAAGVAGSKRLSRGGARDHLLGFRGVSGRGEVFVGGAKVVKNVTGYDLPKLATGSWGRLFALTEITLKVLPRPPKSLTLYRSGLDARRATALMMRAAGSQGDIAAAAHNPDGGGTTVIRLEGIDASLRARRLILEGLPEFDSQAEVMGSAEEAAFWAGMTTLSGLNSRSPLWRINLPSRRSADLVERTLAPEDRWLMDWAGSLVWATSDVEPRALRRSVAALGGHALLLRAPDDVREREPAFHPPAAAVGALESRVRHAFDPLGVFQSGRFPDQVDAH